MTRRDEDLEARQPCVDCRVLLPESMLNRIFASAGSDAVQDIALCDGCEPLFEVCDDAPKRALVRKWTRGDAG